MSFPPPLPEEPARPNDAIDAYALKPSTPPQKGLSGCAVAGIIGAVLAFFGLIAVGILAAIAVPAYHDYVARARVHEAYAQMQSTMRDRVDEAHAQLERCPLNRDLGYDEYEIFPLGAADGADNKGSHYTMSLRALEDGACGIELRFENVSSKIDGRTLILASAEDGWHCLGGTLEDPQRPANCRRDPISNP